MTHERLMWYDDRLKLLLMQVDQFCLVLMLSDLGSPNTRITQSKKPFNPIRSNMLRETNDKPIMERHQ